ncbi:MAG: D-alanyl-D-alanine carboxypeptidase/D-alanyl-D-alanine-endopeptidase [Rubrivivax sp.]
MLRTLIPTLAIPLSLWLAVALPARADDPLPPAVFTALQVAGVPPDALAGIVLPLGHRSRPWSVNANRAMQPASTMKLVTSIVALDRLRATHRGATEFRSSAPLVDGVLQGDLQLVGLADPDLSVPAFWDLLLSLRASGIHTIGGDLVVDRTRFRPARIDQNLPPFDEATEFPSNVIPDALLLAGNLLPMVLRSDANGALQAATVPPLEGVLFDSRMAANDKPCKDWNDDWLPARATATIPAEAADAMDGPTPAVSATARPVTRIELNGAYPRNCTQRVALQLIDRQELAERLFRSLWRAVGGRWDGRAREAAEPLPPSAASALVAPSRLLARHEARPWGEVLRAMNKQSDNAIARLLLLELGAVAGAPAERNGSRTAVGAGGSSTTTLQAARAEVRRWLLAQRIDPTGMVVDNGSGLSRSERITPMQLASMLRVAWADPQAPDLLASLPVAGVDGTMRRRLKDSPAAGLARLKSGTLRNVTALAGIVVDNQGRPWAVALMVNHDNAARARPALDALIDGIARFGPHGRAPLPIGPKGNGP